MIDNFALAVSHGLLILAVWRLLTRADLDDDAAPSDAGARKFTLGTALAKAKDRIGA